MDWKKISVGVHNFDEEKELIGILLKKVPSAFSGHDYIVLKRNNKEGKFEEYI